MWLPSCGKELSVQKLWTFTSQSTFTYLHKVWVVTEKERD